MTIQAALPVAASQESRLSDSLPCLDRLAAGIAEPVPPRFQETLVTSSGGGSPLRVSGWPAGAGCPSAGHHS